MFKDNKGIVLITTYTVVFVLTSLLAVYAARSINENNLAEIEKNSVEAFYIAEAGIQKALWIFSNKALWVTISSPDQIHNNDWLTSQINTNNNFGNGSFQVEITGDGANKTIRSSSTISSVTRGIQVQIQNTWLDKIPSALYSRGPVMTRFDWRDDAYIDGGNKPGIYSCEYVWNWPDWPHGHHWPHHHHWSGDDHIEGNPPILEDQDTPEALEDGIWDVFDFNTLRQIAQANGTYFAGEDYGHRHGSYYNNPFNRANRYTLPIEEGQTYGVFFFDAINGEPLDDDEVDPRNQVRVKLEGTTEPMSGIIVVVGDLDIKDTRRYDFLFDGVILVLDDLTIHDSRHHRRWWGGNDSDICISGTVLSENLLERGRWRRKNPTARIYNASIEYDAESISYIPTPWVVVPGSWQEI